MPIHILSDQLASQIAAGEVVERPASVVKELVENALDAGASTINVDIREGGQALIQIADDGSGIPAGELETAFRRHATSKLTTAEDLAAIHTLGFRGEALAAIAAVSQLTAVTRTDQQEAGSRLVLEAGKTQSHDTVGAPRGTVIAVENLFYNLPARRKFLKSITTERRLIDEFVTRYAIAYPHVRFRLVHDGRVTFQSSGNGELRDVLLAVYGADIAKELLEIERQDSETRNQEADEGHSIAADYRSAIKVRGFIGPPNLHRSNRNQIMLYVNGRWVKDNSLTYAIIQAYHTLLPTGRYPLAIIFLQMPFDHVDVNVHPAKTEVRFRLVHDGRVTFQSSGNGELRDVLLAVYGADIAKELLEIERQNPETRNQEADKGHSTAADYRSAIKVGGFIGPPNLHRSNRNQIMLYVNGRWVKDNSLTYAIIQAYHTLLPTGRYPLAVIFLQMPFDHVDVNVHPAKTEVRFRNGNGAFSAVQRAVRRTLVEGSPVRNIGLGAGSGSPTPGYSGWGGTLNQEAFSRHDLPTPQGNLHLSWPEQSTEGTIAPQVELAGDTSARKELPIMRVVGQVGAAYIIAEGPDGIFLIDQHAAHERILYEQFMAARDRNEIASQGLVTGETVQLPPDQAALLEEHLEMLGALGFQVEPFGPNTFVVRAVPALLSKLDPAAGLRAVVEDLESGNDPLEEREEARVILRVCKTAAVKAGQSLAAAEMEAMIQQLERCQNPHTCPHGRPTLIHLSASTLAKQFGRT